MTRTTTSTQGKRVSFAIDQYYFIIGGNKDIVFENCKSKYCVCYTKVGRDCGVRSGMRWGSPCIEEYDNGNVGYQYFNFFDDLDEAKKDFDARKRLSPKPYKRTVAYADVFLIENDKC